MGISTVWRRSLLAVPPCTRSTCTEKSADPPYVCLLPFGLIIEERFQVRLRSYSRGGEQKNGKISKVLLSEVRGAMSIALMCRLSGMLFCRAGE